MSAILLKLKKAPLAAGTKAKHLTYLGDAIIGNRVNIGAGTIICNHDGKRKHTTTIKDDAYIGSNNTLIAPLTIEENAYTAAGSTINKDVPANALAIGRALQVIKEGYAQKLRGTQPATTIPLNTKKLHQHLPTQHLPPKHPEDL